MPPLGPMTPDINMFLIEPDGKSLISATAMDLIAQISILFAAFIVTCHSLPGESKPLPEESESLTDESKSLPDELKSVPYASKLPHDPSVFEMQTPPGFIKFLPMNGKPEIGKFPFWATPIENVAENIKFPDWFHFSDNKPGKDIQVDKNKDKDSGENNAESNNVDGKETVYEFTYNDPNSNSFDAKDVFPSYYNVFLSNAYPSWLAMPGFNGLTNVKKEGDDIKVESIKVSSEIQPNKNKESNGSDNDTVAKFTDSSLSDGRKLILSKVEDPHPIFFPKENADMEKENKPININLNDLKSLGNKSIHDDVKLAKINQDGAIIVPVQVLPVQLSRINIQQNQNNKESVILPSIPNNHDGNTQDSASDSQIPTDKTQQNPDAKSESVKIISQVEDESGESKANNSRNLMPNNYLYNLLQQAKPLLSSISSDNKGSFSSNTQIAAMLFPSQDPPKSQGRSVISGNNVVINNGDKVQNVDQTTSSNDETLTNTLHNTNPQTFPNNGAVNQGNIPNNAGLNQPYINGNMNTPVNAPAYNYAVPYGNANQNNYLQNPGQAVLVSLPYNSNAPTNYLVANPASLQQWNGQQGNFNGQNIQSNGPGYPISSNNNVALVHPANTNTGYVSPGANPGQNLYAIVPIANGNVGNVNAGPYVNGNPQSNPMYQVVGPLYNMVPVQNSAVMNTKDEEE